MNAFQNTVDAPCIQQGTSSETRVTLWHTVLRYKQMHPHRSCKFIWSVLLLCS